MKKSIALLLLSLTILIHTVSAQEDHRECGSATHYAEMLQSNPGFANNRQLIEQQTAQFAQQHSHATRTVKIIPVVVHVVYNTALQNISDAQINSQIAVLNADFRKLNADQSNTPAVFAPYAADCEVQFVLAQRDPNGNATNGITRTYSTTTSWPVNDQMKNSATGGANPWPAADYLNIWVCKLSGSTLGYAQFPGGPAATDGVVIATKAFGTIPGSGLSAVYNKGRTATHEIGHWLNLFHIWGDDGGTCNGTDLVNDTPNQGNYNFGCPTFPHLSCSNDPDGDMFMNFMDYTNDACMNMFTAGQKARMDAVFAAGGARASLLSSLGGTPPPTPVCDVPVNVNTSAVTETDATISWDAAAGSVNYEFQYKESSASVWTSVSTSATTITLTNLTSNTSYDCQIRTNCALGQSAFSTVTNFTTLAPPPPPVLCTDSYEPNEARLTSPLINVDVDIHSMIGTVGDADYYKFNTTSSAPKFKITLTDLPDDYDVRLFSPRGLLLGSGTNGGTTNESITYNGANVGGTFYVSVTGFNGAFSSAACYKLHIETSANNLRSEEMITDESKAEIITYPNPAQGEFNANVHLSAAGEMSAHIYNSIGQVVLNQTYEGSAGFNTIQMNTLGMPNGFYLLELNYGDEHRVQKFVIEK